MRLSFIAIFAVLVSHSSAFEQSLFRLERAHLGQSGIDTRTRSVAVNNRGDIETSGSGLPVGQSTTSRVAVAGAEPIAAFAIIDLGTLGGSTIDVVAITDAGQVVGSSSLAGDAITHAFSWTAAGGMIDLGTLDDYSTAFAVNDGGQVVGRNRRNAFSWTASGGMIDLGSLGGFLVRPLRSITPDRSLAGARSTKQVTSYTRFRGWPRAG